MHNQVLDEALFRVPLAEKRGRASRSCDNSPIHLLPATKNLSMRRIWDGRAGFSVLFAYPVYPRILGVEGFTRILGISGMGGKGGCVATLLA